jgi:hypothetical protein
MHSKDYWVAYYIDLHIAKQMILLRSFSSLMLKPSSPVAFLFSVGIYTTHSPIFMSLPPGYLMIIWTTIINH